MADYIYDSNMPLTTMTQYPLEAFVRYTDIAGDDQFVPIIKGICRFLEQDIKVMDETPEYLVTSYAAFRDRRVINAVSYVMFSYCLALPYLDSVERARVEEKIRKLYAYIASNQKADGSWLYSPEGHSFIDCYHSCIVLKNIIKTDAVFSLPGSREIVERGYEFVKGHFLVKKAGLFKRFVESNKPSLVRFDLYDNAEVLGLASLMGDAELVGQLSEAIERAFIKSGVIYSQIDCFGLKHGPNTLRWAVMPYFYALSRIETPFGRPV